MKTKPEEFLVSKEEIKYKKILVSGSDDSLIGHVTDFIVNSFKNKNYYIDNSGAIQKNQTGNLFTNNKILFLLKTVPQSNEAKWLENNPDHRIVVSSNNNKINAHKLGFSKSENSLLIDCYPLGRVGKEKVIRYFVSENNICLSNSVFWYLLESLENEYVLLINQLKTLSLFGKKVESVSEIEKIVSIENKVGVNKLFFHILKNNRTLLKLFNKNIYSQSDLYLFISSLKLYLRIVALSNNKQASLSSLPKYLFNEKEIFLKISNMLNNKKIEKIYKNIFRVEKLLRKNSELYLEIGFRFILSTKKIICS